MLENIEALQKLAGLARRKLKDFEIKAIHPSDKDKYEKEGWQFVKSLKSSIQVKRKKSMAFF